MKLRDIDGDGRGIRIFASPEIYPSADMSAGRAWAISKTSTGGTDTYSVVTGNKVCNLQFFAVLGVDGRGRSSVDTLSSLNAIAPNVLFFVKYSLTSGSAAPRTMITTLSSIYNIADMLEVDTSINWNGEDSPLPDIVFDSNETDVQTIAQATLDKYLSANVARKMLAERTAESITLAVGDAATDVAAKITWTPFSMVFPLGTVGSYTFTPTFQYTKTRTCEAGFSCAVYVSGKAGVARLGVFCFPGGSNVFASTSQPENAQPSSCLKFCFDPDSGGSAAEAALYALYSRERYAMQSAIARAAGAGVVETQEWNEKTKVGKWLVSAKAAMHLAEVDAQASGETLVPFRKDDDAGTLTVGNVGAVRYKGNIHGVVACWPDVASSALAYGELEEVDGRPCSFAFVVTVRSGGLHVWIPAAEAACRPDDFTQLSVSCLSDSTVGAPRIAVAGSCLSLIHI